MTWWLAALLGAVALLIPTAYAGYIGAPFVPTRRQALEHAFDAIKLGPADTLVDLGCGDGGVLAAAAQRGAAAVGYELSPIMWAIAKVRGQRAYLRNFYRQPLPPETTVIFTFLMPKNLPRLIAYLKKQKLPEAKYLLSYTFALPQVAPAHVVQTKTYGTVYVYNWEQLR